MGRPRKPTALKVLDRDRKDRIHGDEPTAPPGIGDPPDWLDRFGKDAWSRLVESHRLARLLTRLDVEAATLYCLAYSNYRHALKVITEDMAAADAEPFRKVHPMFRVANASHAQMMRILSKFGMTPSDRAGLHVEAPPESDPLIKYLHDRKGKARTDGKAR